jgi:hypothetical protein
MTDLAESCNSPNRFDDVVRRLSLRLVDDKRAINWRRFWLS